MLQGSEVNSLVVYFNRNWPREQQLITGAKQPGLLQDLVCGQILGLQLILTQDSRRLAPQMVLKVLTIPKALFTKYPFQDLLPIQIGNSPQGCEEVFLFLLLIGNNGGNFILSFYVGGHMLPKCLHPDRVIIPGKAQLLFLAQNYFLTSPDNLLVSELHTAQNQLHPMGNMIPLQPVNHNELLLAQFLQD